MNKEINRFARWSGGWGQEVQGASEAGSPSLWKGSIRFSCPKPALVIELSSRGCQQTRPGLEAVLLRSPPQLALQVTLQGDRGQLQS